MTSLADRPEVVGFFSYSREDDHDSQGALSALRERIQGELRGQLGRSAREFRLWQDKEAIAPGRLWEAEITAAINEAVFFIAIVTPTAVRSEYCRFEFEAFLEREKVLARADLVFPLLYIRVPALEDAGRVAADPVLSIIAHRQYVDWRAYRHHDLAETEVAQAIEALCSHIAEALSLPQPSDAELAERRRQEEAERQEQGPQEEGRQEEGRQEEVERQEQGRQRQEEAEREAAAEERREQQEEIRRREEATRPLPQGEEALRRREVAVASLAAARQPQRDDASTADPPRRNRPGWFLPAAVAAGVLITAAVGFAVWGVFDPHPKPVAAPAGIEATKPQPNFRDCPDCPEMVWLPPGRLMMGSDKKSDPDSFDDEWPLRPVTVKAGFAIGKYPVTRAEYAKFLAATKRTAPATCASFPQTDRDPAVCVTWDDATAYARWLSQTTGKTYRLPTEAEWEYAARAGTTTSRYWGNGRPGPADANCRDSGSRWSGRGTAPVGSFRPNQFGLYDMLGNVFQWVQDCWADNHAGASDDAAVARSGNDCKLHVLRGGCWMDYSNSCRSAYRLQVDTDNELNFVGFRVARTP